MIRGRLIWLCCDDQRTRPSVYAECGAEFHQCQPCNRGKFVTQVILEFACVIECDRMPNRNIQLSDCARASGNMSCKSRDTIMFAEHEAAQCNATIGCCVDNRHYVQKICDSLDPFWHTTTTHRITQVIQETVAACLGYQRLDLGNGLLSAYPCKCTLSGEHRKHSLTQRCVK